jgi:hypothetical protein
MKKISKSMQQESTALAAMPESEIDFTDIPPTEEKDWLGAVRGKVGRAALDNPDLPASFIAESLISMAEPRNQAKPFVPRSKSN